MWGSSGLAEELSVSQEKLCYMHLFGFIFICECHWILTWGIVWSQELCKFWVLWYYQRFSSCSDITPCHWTNSSHASKDHNPFEALWTVCSVIQHRIPEVVNLQMEGIFILIIQYFLVVVVHHIYVQCVTSRTIWQCELIFMLRCKSLSSKGAEYRSVHWYICGWVREMSVLREGTERWTWSHRLQSSLVFKPSVLLAWRKR